MQGLNKKVVIITGAGSGIGKSVAIAFAKHNTNIVIGGRNEQAHNQTVNEINKMGGEAIYVKTDVTQASDVKSLITQAVKYFGKLDYAFNNAGFLGDASLGIMHKNTEDNFIKIMDTNVKGTWLCMKYQIPEMLKNRGGCIVNCASLTGLIGYEKNCEYSASKHAIVGLSKSAALQYAKHKLRINTICPGPTDTKLIRNAYGSNEKFEAHSEAVPMKRIAHPDEIAGMVVWLCSEASSFITGQNIAIDGGIMAGIQNRS